MGISLELWRIRIGVFGHISASNSHVTLCCAHSHRLLAVIAYLLLIGCVELNPGPPKVDFQALEERLDDFAIEVRATRAEAQQERQALSDQLTIHNADAQRGIQALEAALTVAVNRIATLERSLATANLTIAKLEAATVTLAAPTPPINTPTVNSTTTGNNVASLAGELRERANRSKNVLIFGVKYVNQDENSVEHIITNELNLQVRPTSVSRLGKGNGGRPAPLFLKFSTSDDAASVIKFGKNLRSSTDNDIKSSVFISTDYTKLERHE